MPKSKAPTVAITGASGFLGSVLARYFAEHGYRVIGLARNPDKIKVKLIEYRQYDLSQPVASDLLEGVDYLIHTAYVKSGDRRDALDANLDGAHNLITVSRRCKIQKNIFISSMSAHEDAVSIYGQQKLAIEKLFEGSRDLVIRSGLIIGNGGIVAQMTKFMRSKHLVPLIGGGHQPLQVIGVNDLAKAIDRAIQQDINGRRTLASAKVYSYREFYRRLAKSIGVKVLFIPVPYWLLLALLTFAGWLRLPIGVGADNLLGLKMLRSTDTKVTLKEFGLSSVTLSSALQQAKLK